MPEGTPVRVTYKVNGEEFFVFADQDYLQKWQKDKTIPLVQVAACKF
jgi:ribosome maturation protein Sdo1